ncbi:hypothetical protein [Dongia sp.]|uniref:hypothetical protein n=1 Tax=Dongia sp. TaxID=1977262 RepID=UPI0035AF0800
MQAHSYSYKEALNAAQKINWRIEDIIGGDKQLDFSRPFMPETMARVEPLTFLKPADRIVLNQIRGYGYLSTFGLSEEFILPFILDHARQVVASDDWQIRALLQFAGEEAKHIHLFKRFCSEFEDGFGTDCEIIGPAEDIAKAILAHPPLAVALLILHIEWMTQSHYLDSVKDDRGLDPQFKSLLRHHWMEEAQHAKLDTLIVEHLASRTDAAGIAEAIDGYMAIGAFLDTGLSQQAKFDLESFQSASGRRLSGDEQETFLNVQHQALRWTFIGSGMTHQNFLITLGRISPDGRKRVDDVAPAFC